MDTQGWTCSERQGQNIQGRQLLRCLPVIPHSGYTGPCVITSLGWPGKLLLKNMAEVMGHPPEIRLQRLWFHLAHPLSLSPVLTRMESTCWVVSCPREQSTWQWGPVASYSHMSGLDMACPPAEPWDEDYTFVRDLESNDPMKSHEILDPQKLWSNKCLSLKPLSWDNLLCSLIVRTVIFAKHGLC